jgi:hypothetical protein
MPTNQNADEPATDGHEPSEEHYRLVESTDVPPGATVDRSADGSLTSIVTADGEWSVHVNPNTEFGATVQRIADEQGVRPGQCIREAIQAYAVDEDSSENDRH